MRKKSIITYEQLKEHCKKQMGMFGGSVSNNTYLEHSLVLNLIEEHEKMNLIEKEIRADEREKVLDKVAEKIKNRLIDNLDIENATKYGNKNAKQQGNSYAPVMKYEIAECVDDLLDDLAEMKEGAE